MCLCKVICNESQSIVRLHRSRNRWGWLCVIYAISYKRYTSSPFSSSKNGSLPARNSTVPGAMSLISGTVSYSLLSFLSLTHANHTLHVLRLCYMFFAYFIADCIQLSASNLLFFKIDCHSPTKPSHPSFCFCVSHRSFWSQSVFHFYCSILLHRI